MLTLPERVLIACYYLAAYIIKLYPKRQGNFSTDSSTLNSGLCGNVLSYQMNTQDIASMVQGHFLPPSPKILSATISVTFIGPGNIRDHCLPSILMVSRSHVRNALKFLCCENPLYHNIIISDNNLDLLPINAVPEEIIRVVQQSEDVEALEKEQADYVLEDEFDNNGESVQLEDSNKPVTISIQAYGVLDPGISDLNDRHVLAQAFANASFTSDETYVV
ncbi:hypothetical protein J3R82DRAFT_9689 [Butyriboletus roseoflavus]|nr:hypothetical protein J3R82DRAFT_9689 [Butyriboletus roseoflavus]